VDGLPDSLQVSLNDYHVGTLVRLPGTTIAFFFTQRFIDDEQRPTLSWGFYDAYRRLRVQQPSSSRGLVPAFFANLLPEGDLRRYVAHRAGISLEDAFGLLWVTGDDLPGAVALHDPQGRPAPPPAAGVLECDVSPGGMLRFSLAGVQLKFSAVQNARGGLTIRAHGRGGDWIVKLPSRHFDRVPENEFAMLRYAQTVGIEIPEIDLVDVNSIQGLPEETAQIGGPALIARRFDRGEKGIRIHIEDFNQIYRQPPTSKYDNRSFADIAQTAYQAIGNEALIDFVRRLVFNIGIGNNDMHLKNWSFIYRDGRSPALAPAYDYVCTKAYLGDNSTGLALGDARYFQAVTLEQFGRLAQRARVSRTLVEQAATEMVERMRDTWNDVRDRLPLDGMRTAIEQQFERVPLFNPSAIVPVAAPADAPQTEVS
jgi:serine/threonine-protein kinase HipA